MAGAQASLPLADGSTGVRHAPPLERPFWASHLREYAADRGSVLPREFAVWRLPDAGVVDDRDRGEPVGTDDHVEGLAEGEAGSGGGSRRQHVMTGVDRRLEPAVRVRTGGGDDVTVGGLDV